MWTNDDTSFPCSTQTTKFSVDFESIKEKKITCSQGVAGCIEILDYMRDSLILPMYYVHKKCMLIKITQSSSKNSAYFHWKISYASGI